MKCNGLIFIVFFVFYFNNGIAQVDRYRFTRIDINKGLSHNKVNCIFKDSKGFMWFGTSSGLNRYDGYTIKIFRHEIRDSTSISDNEIVRLFEDPDGRIWIYTSMGYNIYDPGLERFSRNTSVLLDSYNIPRGYIRNILKDRKGNFWFVHESKGLFKYNPIDKKTINIHNIPGDTSSLSSNDVYSTVEDSEGNFWFIHSNALLEKMDGNSYKIIYRTHQLESKLKHTGNDVNWSCNLFIDSNDDIWLYSDYFNLGVIYYNTSGKTLLEINKDSPAVRLNANIVHGIVQDNKGLIWIATNHGGVNVIDKKAFTVSYLLNNEEDESSLGQNSVISLYKDYDGIIWAGTYKKGISYYHENIIRFQLYKHRPSNPNSLLYEDVNRFSEDEKGNLWIGTNGGGLLYFNRKTGKFTQYKQDRNNANSLSNNVIVSICTDYEKKLWLGTFDGGLNCFDGKKFVRYLHNPANPKSISDNDIWDIFEDSRKNLWIATLGGGLELYDRKTNTFLHYKRGQENSVNSDYLSSLAEDKDGDLWIGTSFGIDVLQKQSGRFVYYKNDPNDPKSLSSNTVFNILSDKRGWIWIGTGEGLNLFDKKSQSFRVFRKEDGLPHNSISAMLEDNTGNLWISTPNGLCNIVVTQNKEGNDYSFGFKNYEESDGLQGKHFNEFSAYKTKKGELIFGGANGFNIFRPEDIGVNNSVPRIILSDFQVFNKSIGIGEPLHGRVVLEKSITETKEIILNYNDNVFSLEFSALSYFHPEKNKYKYMLEGFSKDWLTTDSKSRRVTFTNLDPGEYVFKVIASNNDDFWNNEELSLKITILPPFWKTKWAYFVYFLLVVGVLYLSRRLILQRARNKFRIEQERQQAQHMHELDLMKIRFFTNVSHEFRTPLALILAPLEKLLKNTKDTDQENQILVIYRNAKRLLNLVNELLDFRRMEVQEVRFNPSQGDIIGFIEEVVNSFSDLSEKKDMQLSFHSTIGELEVFFDQDKLERILFNLLSNAFKFTPEHGTISVEVNPVDNETHDKEGTAWIEIKVKDTGIGIPSEKLDKIFERFFQNRVPKSMVNQGSGIGLSIAKEFVRIHGGTISVESEMEKGSCFTIMLPLREILAEQEAEFVSEEDMLLEAELKHEHDIEHAGESKKPVILLVEDNEDFRFYLKDNLKEFYSIIEGRNGKEGWNKALANIPDLIVSDVMMPEMNGLELCKKTKNDPRTSHIPVILLTARTTEEQKMEGFETGANDYIAKPFNFEILLSRIKNLIIQQDLLRKAFRKQIGAKASEIAVTSLDEKLIRNAIKCVEDNIANPDFSVEELSRELGMSRVYLYKKLLSLTNKSPIEFIRSIRLQQAAQLLEKSQLTVAEVAYQVGFNNPKYFTKYFKKEYNVLPSVYAVKNHKTS